MRSKKDLVPILKLFFKHLQNYEGMDNLVLILTFSLLETFQNIKKTRDPRRILTPTCGMTCGMLERDNVPRYIL